MEKPAPRPKTRQWVTNVDSIHSSAEVMNMAMGQDRTQFLPALVDQHSTDHRAQELVCDDDEDDEDDDDD
eukprot:CAMPEP_0198719688 /NCGR_PEP_ID=MMETSP1471-20131121/57684_1 /TAXON_ID=41880 /ORGANISM="Pycnococcus provasolii, Strain RCC733" /LENGTH=69 /DNA_ID=CAMNT_0044480457 /DNA_START=42 /DNA_END=249 /DNA_ORIENTATION=+